VKACLIGEAEEVVLLVEIIQVPSLAISPRLLTVEFWRGEELRNSYREPLQFARDDRWLRAFRLHWSGRAAASSRLRGRVLLDGCAVGEFPLLFGKSEIDAQGRIDLAREAAASPATLLAFEREFQRLMPGRSERKTIGVSGVMFPGRTFPFPT
jgi:hypothetical protein